MIFYILPQPGQTQTQSSAPDKHYPFRQKHMHRKTCRKPRGNFTARQGASRTKKDHPQEHP